MGKTRSDRVEILELYVPAKLEYLAQLYTWAHEQLYSRPRPLVQGCSIYEVNGAFRSDLKGPSEKPVVYEERTVVVRVIFRRPRSASELRAHYGRVQDVLEDFIVKITGGKEEQLWGIRLQGNRMTGFGGRDAISL